MQRFAAVLFLLAFPAACTHRPASDEKQLEMKVSRLRHWTSDQELLEAVRAQNKQALTQAEVQRRDAAWATGSAEALITSVTTGDCADRLRRLAAESPAYGEILLMDNQGALVCSTHRASDYWQGDEAKWSRTFNEGRGATFIDRPRLDESAGEPLAQISLPIRDSGKVIGAITVGIRMAGLSR